jgi:hypothetical protein
VAELAASDERRLAVAAALRSLERRLDRFATALAHARSAWLRVDGAASPGVAMRQAVEAYTAIDLEMDDAPGASVVCLGVVGAPKGVVDLARSVNEAKAELKAVCAPLQDQRIRVPDGDGTKAVPLIRVILRSLQRSDLNLLAAYRRIPVLESTPLRVAYTRARTRSVYRKLAGDVATMLAHVEGPRALSDRARLAALPAAEQHVALVRDHYENVRANVALANPGPDGRRRLQTAAELPLLYAARRGAEPPAVSFPAPRAAADPIRRRQSRLEPKPLLETLPVFRYRPEYR